MAERRYVKGERRGRVEAVRDAATQVLEAKDYAEAYVAFSTLGQAINDLDRQVAETVKRAERG